MKKHFFSLRERGLFLLLLGLILSFSGYAQNITVKGVVKDSKFGDPIIGASVLQKGTTNGTISDMDGNFILEAPDKAVLVISYIGYKSQEVTISGSQPLNIVLGEDMEALDEVVVVGYATGSKRTISGAVERIKKEDMNQGVVNNPLESIKGKVAGVVITQSGGDPASKPSIRVRGTSSLSGGNDPLVIIDGVFGDMDMLNAIAPADIETFTILKDASETAQYGSRGAAGVIVVTTVKGKNGMKTLSYNGTFGISNVYKNLNMLSADQYRGLGQKLGTTVTDKGFNSNWFDEIEQLGYTQNHNLSFGAGTDDSNYRASVGLIDQQGIIKNSGMRNYTAKLDAMQNMFDNKLKIEFGMFGSLKELDNTNDYLKTFYSAASYNPTFPTVKNDKGVWDEDPMANEIHNPMGRLDIKDRETNAYVNVHGRLTYNILEGLKLSTFGSYTYNVKENKRYFPKDIKASMADGGHAERIDNKQNILMGNIQLTYTKDFNEKHHFDALALVEGQKYHYTGFTAKSHAYETDYFGYNNLKAGGDVKYGDVESLENENRIASFMARVNYMYDNRYIITANLRADGSSKLGSDNKWGFFPSASAAWVINEEAFMKDVDWLSNLKLRAGYGLTGNQDAIEAYNSLALYKPTGVTSLGGSPMATYGIQRNANPDLRWEVKKTFDVGVDFGILNGRYSLTADWYHSKTTDMLYNYSVPVPPFVYPTLLANMGEMTNTGVELAVNAGLVQTKDFEFNMGVNFSWQKNTLNSLSGTYMGQDLSTSKYIALAEMSGAGFVGNNSVVYMMEGQPVGVFYIPRCLGLSEPDANGHRTYVVDETIDGEAGFNANDGGDRYVAGQAMPKYYLGLNLNFRYKRFDLTTQMNGAFGHKIFNGTSLSYMNLSQFPTYNVMDGAQDDMIFAQDITDYWLEKGNYLNIDYITLGYNFNCEKISDYVKNIRLSFSVNNVATITGYSGLSPLLNSQTITDITDAGQNTLGIDNKQFYPLSRTYSLGVSVTF
ncbi:TonB-dependent receptor [uncultured Parabacteroides sp.]|uniref:SusC/RagA family TonB-linked outer membrane protein n=1 Tax=uncultured Parabacteroides sp. TaxID=512312 RepID=UPI00261B7128|nr:TonB-dependent receptor [uncultured Parabacteroides sp.]